MGLRSSLAVLAARLVSFGCRLAGKQGVTTAGTVAMRIDPNILKKLSGQVRKGIFAVCGTNGKTTTNNLLCSALEAEGKKVVCNHTGSNMLAGVAAAFVLNADLRGRLDADYACIEIDEASALRVFPHMKPDWMAITNLFRDQLDRYGEIDITMDLLQRAMDLVPDLKLIADGDDALVAYLAQESKHPFVTYGISENADAGNDSREVREGRYCKRCGAPLVYDFYHYSQLGVYHCSKCSFTRPSIDFDASEIDLRGGLSFKVDGKAIHAPYRGFYNIYNILAAYAAMVTAGITPVHFTEMLASYNPQNGRNELFHIRGSKVLLNLAKNPAGFNQNISSVMADPEKKDLIIVINDNAQDGTDISWLWDVDFDRFADPSVQSITVSGIRCQDMRLRLKYVEIETQLAEDVKTAIEKKLADGCGNLYVLVNYTALYTTHMILQKMQGSGA